MPICSPRPISAIRCSLQSEGRAIRVVMFTRNKLCGFAVPKVGLTTANFVDRLLDPAVKLGTSTPKADPGGDYTWAMFHRIEALRPGSYADPRQKGAADRRRPDQQRCGRRQGSGRRGVRGRPGRSSFIGYCSGAKRLLSQMPALQVAEVPRRDRDRPGIRSGGAQRRRPAHRRSRAVHAVARGPADFRPLRLCSGGVAGPRSLSAAPHSR